MSTSSTRAVALWLFICCALIYAMIVLGGVTRLTHSGLSMVDWDPIMGVVPPLTSADWQEVFDQYKRFPEYQKINTDMVLEDFKKIFYMEYAHRVLGRLIGIAFLIPFLFFLINRSISSSQIPKFVFMFVLGALQGLLGWYMVKSGLVDRPSVSQYRLTAHLIMAMAIYCYMFWVALDWWRNPVEKYSHRGVQTPWGWLTFILVMVMIVSGGFVAGTRAGFIHNTFPMMSGQWVPNDIWSLAPGWRNLLENVITIQFIHRCLAFFVLVAVVLISLGAIRQKRRKGVGIAAVITLLILAMQLGLGVSTLVNKVPTVLAVFHQFGAVALVTSILITLHFLNYGKLQTKR